MSYKPSRKRNLVSTCALIATLSFATFSAAATPEGKLAEFGIVITKTNPPVANYLPAVRSGNLIYIAGTIAKDQDGKFITGKLGENMSIDEGYQAARKVGIALISSLMSEIGDLDLVERIVKVEGFVNCSPTFDKQSLVINGCSDLLVDVFGEKGKHARIAIGANALPFGAPVEISAIIQIRDKRL